MLRNVHIKNMALIDELEVSFEEGLNIMTGETGAGKSIILGSITTALGGRTGKEMLRDGAEYGLVELLFEIDKDETLAALQKLELPLSEERVLIISRRIYPNRTVNRINDETVTVSRLREVAGLLIDIHSQHEHQSLLKKANHLAILDRFAHDRIADGKKLVQQQYDAYSQCKAQLSAMEMDEETRKRQMDFIAYEIHEIQEANLQPEEEEELERRYRRMENSRKIMEAVSQVHAYTGYDATASAGNQLGQALDTLGRVSEYDEGLKDLQEQLGTIDSLVNDFNRELSDYMSSLTFEEQDYVKTQTRLDQIHTLESKYGKTIPQVLEYLDQKQQEYAEYEDYEGRKQQLMQKYQQAEEQYQQAARQLSALRKTAAKQLTAQIRTAMMELNFLDVQFRMEFQELEHPTRDGIDDAWFVLSTNVGESMKPLWEVASGGELSRIMLAIKSCLAQEDAIDTLIFDEIDVGISGRTAQKVSEQLSVLGREHQVICISHLPQIAAMADAHYKIEKKVEENKTITSIWKLSEEASITEIARMLGGVEITDTVKTSAAEMKEMAKRTKLY